MEGGVFLPVPRALASQFPSREPYDSSPPHITMLHLGELEPRHIRPLIRSCLSLCQRCSPFTLELAKYAEFVNADGLTIPHLVPKARRGGGLAGIHVALRRLAEAAELPVEHIEPFRAHATLAYVDPGRAYEGPRPSGRWKVRALEVWIQGRRVRCPLASQGPLRVLPRE